MDRLWTPWRYQYIKGAGADLLQTEAPTMRVGADTGSGAIMGTVG